MSGWPGHGPACRYFDPSASHEAAVLSHYRNCVLPLRLLASLPLELRFEVPIEMARTAARIGCLRAFIADPGTWLPGETTGERELGIARRVLAGRLGLTV